MLRRLYDWMMSFAGTRHASRALAGFSFVESSFFPIPPDILLIPTVLARRADWWRLAGLCTIASVLGGLFGYFIGAVLFDSLAQPILEFYGYADKFAEFKDKYNAWGAWIVFVFGLTPMPYKVVTIASGATGLSLPIFIVASLVSRGLRFFVLAGLLYVFGPAIRQFIERYLGLLFAAFCIILIGGFLLLPYLI